MKIAGILKTSLIDFPGNISTVIFTGGCNLRCRYCYNIDLIESNPRNDVLSEKELFEFLEKRKNLLDGITVSGGEPCLQKDITEFIGRLRPFNLKIKIDTNGFFPEKLGELLEKQLIDYAAVDIKTSPSKYNELTAVNCDISKLKKSLELLKTSGIEFELRTTAVPGFVSHDDFREIGNFTGKVKNYYIQQFVNENTLDPEFEKKYSLSSEILKSFCGTISEFAENVAIRGL
ncbi:MAG: anaerobic ribonucleoside-triphosphate reductase activating protein [Spirochaetes bacterium]|nr:anaerobic ribonucleoside-triphosphate reductase activating protein [Spirochaetota bacterium]